MREYYFLYQGNHAEQIRTEEKITFLDFTFVLKSFYISIFHDIISKLIFSDSNIQIA